SGFLLLNFASLFVFASLAGAGFLLRRRPGAHKRLMLMSTVGGLMPPGVARLPLVSPHLPAIAAVAIGFLLAVPTYDLLTRRRLHPASAAGVLAALLGTPPVVTAVSATAPWHQIAALILG